MNLDAKKQFEQTKYVKKKHINKLRWTDFSVTPLISIENKETRSQVYVIPHLCIRVSGLNDLKIVV
jgi:hypothetical protein